MDEPPDTGELDATELVGRICTAAVSQLAFDGAGVSLIVERGHSGVVYASDPTARALEQLSFDLGEGPAVEAFRHGAAVVAAGLDWPTAVAQWPAYARSAGALGVRAMVALPTRLGTIRLGTVSLYRRVTGGLTTGQLTRAQHLADTVTIALLQLRADAADEPFDASGLPDDFYPAEVYQATGMLTVQLGVDIATALVRLQSYAFAHDRPIGDVAHDIVERTLQLEQDGA